MIDTVHDAAQMRAITHLWQSVMARTMLDWRNDWLKTRRDTMPAEIRRYLTSRDGRDVAERAGMSVGHAEIEAVIAQVTGETSKLDIGRHGQAGRKPRPDILRMHAQGLSNTAIGDQVGLSRARVGQIIKEAQA